MALNWEAAKEFKKKTLTFVVVDDTAFRARGKRKWNVAIIKEIFEYYALKIGISSESAHIQRLH